MSQKTIILNSKFLFEAEDFNGKKKYSDQDLLINAPTLDLRSEQIHVFAFGLDEFDESAFEILDSDEKVRANRFLHSRVRQRFITSHSLTRMILGHLLGCSPESVRYQVDNLGKPRLVSPSTTLQFSLSHSGARGMVAVAVGFEVGIDIEHHQSRDLIGLSRRFFHPCETSVIESLAGESQATAFFQCWTRKEAFVKGLGMGLHFPLSSFQVDPSTAARNASSDGDPTNATAQLLLGCDSIPDATSNWRLMDLPIHLGDSETKYSAALAANRNQFEISRWRLAGR